MTEPSETLLIGGGDPAHPRRTGTHRGGWRRPDPIILAALAAGVLVVLGIGFAVFPPLVAHPKADVLPVSSGAPGKAVPVPAGSPSPPVTASPVTSLPPVTSTGKPTAKPSDLENQLVSLTNQARSQAGCHPVKNDGHLRSAARSHSNDMARKGFVGHAGSDGSSFADRIRKAGYRHPLSENVGQGYRTAQQAITAWLADPAQRANIVNCGAKAVGVGVVVAKNGTAYWTQDFGN
ncbi:CAP domain-containing protein [Rugosimonospora africana]|uniref:SCP domain-containing protein n=1 Tax=Rugosimonospora africana TaxID=556532 RepID=A0A8J3QN71_9ACTN|nr:CAP domain-containing protein [Rugosimonospora africana]GIH13591.1 hypothetical protein Raf01_17630 [Rugosimonospora africana]